MKINQKNLLLELARQRMTVTELCKKADVSYPVFQKICAGKHNPKPVTVGKLAKALDIQPEELIEEV